MKAHPEYKFGSYLLKDGQLYEVKELTEELVAPFSTRIRILEYLISNRQRIVSYSELGKQIWPDELRTDEESISNRIHVHIRELREKIGKDIIRNFPKHGYRFAVEVEELNKKELLEEEALAIFGDQEFLELVGKVVRKMARKLVSKKLQDFFEFEYVDQYCNEQMVTEVCALENSLLEETTETSREMILMRHRVNNQIIKCVKIKQGIKDQESLTGYYVLYPLTRECDRLVKKGTLLQSKQIEPFHICETFNQATSLYLSMVYGKDCMTKAFLVYILKRDITEILRTNKNIKCIYTRPCTRDGFRVAEKNGFSPLPTNLHLYHKITE